jgi:hypothetical protein
MKRVYIGDDTAWDSDEIFSRFVAMKSWAAVNCESFITMQVADVSDVSMAHDYMAEFTFNNDSDVVLFILRWK